MESPIKNPHIPVLLDEIVKLFANIKDGYIVDCTAGFGGHSNSILQTNTNIKLIYNDQDTTALSYCENRLASHSSRVIQSRGNFKDLISRHKQYNIKGILADIGVSSLQLDNLDRGFGFESQSLDMRMDKDIAFSAYEVVNTYSQLKLENILKDYGEVREYKKIASLIIQNRPFSSAKQLSQMLNANLYKGKINPATLTFQAIRIEVNNELGVLKELFEDIQKQNLKDCLVAIISFHSLEDRIVKQYFKKWSQKCICPQYLDQCQCGNNNQKGKIITKKPIIPTKDEIRQNPRSRSSKLRVFRFE